ncbi:MAG: hypothetical protein ACD_28C00145G0002 [uncultured bacterium]|nr:MAG: hypothetical protein ACD_28C00145G0002 [uncultured bacterium]
MRLVLSVLLCLLFTIPLVFSSTSSFPDTAFHAYTHAIDFAEKQGTISGYPDGFFRPQFLINRAELVKIMVNSTLEAQDIFTDQLFPDVPASEWFAPYVSTAARHQIVSGYPDGTFQPGNRITFVEAAKIIALSLDVPIEENSDAEAPWYEGYVEALESRGAIPPTIHYLDHEVTRGDITEILYRLEEKLANEPSVSYETLTKNAAVIRPAFEYSIDGSTTIIAMDAERVHMNVLNGNDSIRPVECDYPHHCVAEIQAESFQNFLERSHQRLLMNGAFFDAYTYPTDGVNYHETGGDILLNGEMKSMFGWDEAFGDGGLLAQMKDGSYRFYYPIREWIDDYEEIEFAISNYPLVLNEGVVIDEATYVKQTENDSKFWLDARRAGLGLSQDGQTIYYVSVYGDVVDLGLALNNAGATSGFHLDSGASFGLSYQNEMLFQPGRNIVTAVEFY